MLESLIAYLPGLMGIVVIDLVLSGDNALVIGMAARRLPPHRQRLAIVLGGGAAIGLRVLFAAIAALLLQVPLLQAAGGVILLWIAWKLLKEGDVAHQVEESVSMLGAMRTIILADVVMSLDNILAIAGVSHGSIPLLLFGLLLSMPLILFGSGLIATIMNRFPGLMLIGSGLLAWTAGKMLVEDQIVGAWLPHDSVLAVALPVALPVAVLLPSLWSKIRSLLAGPGLPEGGNGLKRMLPLPVPLEREERRGVE